MESYVLISGFSTFKFVKFTYVVQLEFVHSHWCIVLGGRCIPQFVFSIIDGYWGDFQLWIIMDTAALNMS